MIRVLTVAALAGVLAASGGAARAADLDFGYNAAPTPPPAYPPAPVESVEGLAYNSVIEAAPPTTIVPPIGAPITIGPAVVAPIQPPSPTGAIFYPRPITAPRPAYGPAGAYAAAPPPPPPPALPYGYGY